MTCKEKYVILSVSEISHDQSENYILCGNSPSPGVYSLDIDAKTVNNVNG